MSRPYAISRSPGLSNLVKFAAGLSQKREMPQLARETFRGWFNARKTRRASGTRVVLWPDTFNNYFFPHTAQAAVEVRIIDALPEIRSGAPIVMLEPSGASVFRDEMPNLLAGNAEAVQLAKQVLLFSEVLDRSRYKPPHLERKAIVHGHCHQKAVMGMDSETKLLSEMGMQADLLDSGCCGMAGSFGFESGRADVSIRIGERALLPKVRETSGDTLILADGFSCREQIAQATERRALHIAEAMQIALHEGPDGPHTSRPESRYVQEPARGLSNKEKAVLAGGVALLAAGGLFLYSRRRA